MNLEQAKYEISQKLLLLKKQLQYRHIEILQDDENKSEELCFNGWMTIEGFQNEILYEIYTELESLIQLCYLNELSEEKRDILVQSIIDDLDFEGYRLTYNYNERLEALTSEQLGNLEDFQAEQYAVRQTIIKQLTDKYLSNTTLDKTKIAKMIWKGDQQELAGLFYQLETKGWINRGNNKLAYYRTLATIFEVPGKDKLLENLTTYFTKNTMKYSIFQNLAPNKIT